MPSFSDDFATLYWFETETVHMLMSLFVQKDLIDSKRFKETTTALLATLALHNKQDKELTNYAFVESNKQVLTKTVTM